MSETFRFISLSFSTSRAALILSSVPDSNRIFNPILQGEKFDHNGEYVTKWCPELKNVPIEFLHKPWEMPEQLQNQINFKLGHSYPLPIVKHVEARNSALKAFQDLKK